MERLNRALKQEGLSALSVPGQAFVLVESGPKGLRLSACDDQASHLGLRPGQRLADARAQVPDLASSLHEPEKDLKALLALARWSERWSPWIAPEAPDGLALDVTGIAHLFGGEEMLLADMRERFHRLGFQVRLGLAGTLGAAWALARFSSRVATVAAEGKEREELKPYPVEALRLEPDTATLLRRLGLKTVGSLYSIPRGELVRRFHGGVQSAQVILRVDQALGLSDEPLSPMRPPPLHSVRHALMDPLLTSEAIIGVLDLLVGRLCHKLEGAGEGATRLSLRLYRTDGSRILITAGLAAPSDDPLHITRLLAPKLDKVDAGFGIDAMSLDAEETAFIEPFDPGFLEDRVPLINDFAELADRIVNRHGEARLGRLEALGRHRPEAAEQLQSPFLHSGSVAELDDRSRPLTLLERPEEISVMAEVPDGPPLRFVWRHVSHRVLRVEGPERIASEWWRAEGGEKPPRDYYVVEDEGGRRFWLFREGVYGDPLAPSPSWFIHGLLA
ncbi:MAG TPA: DNA polymerase Y family protein [Aestuariivirgaceae bacterium]|nr:DNA polymerase Y family protein [Aestuariivirgaceae bacterium]